MRAALDSGSMSCGQHQLAYHSPLFITVLSSSAASFSLKSSVLGVSVAYSYYYYLSLHSLLKNCPGSYFSSVDCYCHEAIWFASYRLAVKPCLWNSLVSTDSTNCCRQRIGASFGGARRSPHPANSYASACHFYLNSDCLSCMNYLHYLKLMWRSFVWRRPNAA